MNSRNETTLQRFKLIEEALAASKGEPNGFGTRLANLEIDMNSQNETTLQQFKLIEEAMAANKGDSESLESANQKLTERVKCNEEIVSTFRSLHRESIQHSQELIENVCSMQSKQVLDLKDDVVQRVFELLNKFYDWIQGQISSLDARIEQLEGLSGKDSDSCNAVLKAQVDGLESPVHDFFNLLNDACSVPAFASEFSAYLQEFDMQDISKCSTSNLDHNSFCTNSDFDETDSFCTNSESEHKSLHELYEHDTPPCLAGDSLSGHGSCDPPKHDNSEFTPTPWGAHKNSATCGLVTNMILLPALLVISKLFPTL